MTLTRSSFSGPIEQRNVEDFIKAMPEATAALGPAAKGLKPRIKAKRGKVRIPMIPMVQSDESDTPWSEVAERPTGGLVTPR
jgi:hypothetical protein